MIYASSMTQPDPDTALAFVSTDELATWLKTHHADEAELYVKVFKKRSGMPSVTWGEIVLETLCWGWIDGVKKSLGEDAYLQRITPRRASSAWSKRNTEHAERLIAGGRMEQPGLEQVRAAKADGRWENAYLPPSETEVPADFVKALDQRGRAKAKRFFEKLNKSSRYAITYGLTTAKRPETRERRFARFMDMLARGEEPGFGFKKPERKK